VLDLCPVADLAQKRALQANAKNFTTWIWKPTFFQIIHGLEVSFQKPFNGGLMSFAKPALVSAIYEYGNFYACFETRYSYFFYGLELAALFF
jgi:hypothetical protein